MYERRPERLMWRKVLRKSVDKAPEARNLNSLKILRAYELTSSKQSLQKLIKVLALSPTFSIIRPELTVTFGQSNVLKTKPHSAESFTILEL